MDIDAFLRLRPHQHIQRRTVIYKSEKVNHKVLPLWWGRVHTYEDTETQM